MTVWLLLTFLALCDCGMAEVSTGQLGTTPLVVYGSVADASEFPWHATLYKTKGNKKQYICGATIIKNDLLITAAHCVYNEMNQRFNDPSNYYISVGSIWRDWNIEKNQVATVQKARVKKIFNVCNYLGLHGNYESDIAILQIDKILEFNSAVKPASLDSNEQTVFENGDTGKIVSFERALEEPAFILRAASVPLLSLSRCKSAVPDDIRFLTVDKLCAGYTNGSSVMCAGDSGSGLVFRTNNLWYLRGIVSIGAGSSEKGSSRMCNPFFFYTKISSYMNWIQDVMSSLENNRSMPACP